MKTFDFSRRLCLLGGLGAAATAAFGQGTPAFPARPVKTLLPYSAGSGPDAVVRHVSDKLSGTWKQPFVIDNKPGANGWLAVNEAKRAAADGYTLVGVDNTHFSLQPHLYKQLPFSPKGDFEPVAPLYFTHFFVVVPADSPWNSVADLVAAAKSRNGQLTYGSWGIGSVGHVGAAMLENATGTRMTHVPFKELPQLYTAVASGEVAWAFGTAATVGPLFKAKKVKFIALAAPRRLDGYGDIPTVAEAGGPAGFELKTWVALFAPKGTPQPVIAQLNEGVGKALREPDVRQRLTTVGFEPWIGSPAELTQAVEADTRRFADIVRQARISLD
ncbi:tripartite tricarboxylate transporter substrate binding protein [Ramlibacter sp. AW1]|uniref:Tripartite tricarboxylate transporter substrate binding protein n=1 Tax=Ramlibacter aurantiacus TaxID=2801330 RepID=A0A937D798_9BURK|nr:tripartite tricarboxylate transporter substrate binding protein [Ramlibacter aurantiacus]MBL0420711.1 tripartite tricarboxylate transporter substrate binding protein [Ramlibacter aurantiacus]